MLRSRGRFWGAEIDAKRHQIAAWLRNGCRRPLEWLLERSWRPSEPKKRALERLLAGPRGISRQVSSKKGSNMGPKKFLWVAVFGVPIWVGFSKSLFGAFQEHFSAFQEHFGGFPRYFWGFFQEHVQGFPRTGSLKGVGRRCQAAWPFGSAVPPSCLSSGGQTVCWIFGRSPLNAF